MGRRREATLYVILGSHACRTGMLLLEHKGIAHRTVTIPTGLHPVAVRLLGFPAKGPPRLVDGGSPRRLRRLDRLGTVPALRMDGERVQTNLAIARFLELAQPDPPLFPADPELRRQVESAERWGDETLQMVARRLGLAGSLHGPEAMEARGGDGRLGPLLWRNDRVRLLGSRWIGRRFFEAGEERERAMLAELPAMLDRVDAWIAEGVLNGEALNAADLMIAPSLALLCYRRDLRAEVEGRPAGRLVERVLPEPAR
jgi:glutathione S-transferase